MFLVQSVEVKMYCYTTKMMVLLFVIHVAMSGSNIQFIQIYDYVMQLLHHSALL